MMNLVVDCVLSGKLKQINMLGENGETLEHFGVDMNLDLNELSVDQIIERYMRPAIVALKERAVANAA